MAGEQAREYPFGVVHAIARDYTFSDLGSTITIGDVPAGRIIGVINVKETDFNAGSTATIDVGIDYSDSTTDDTDALVDGAGLTSAVAQGPTRLAFVDNSKAKLEVPATITATLAATGTAATTGAATVIVEYIPASIIRTAE